MENHKIWILQRVFHSDVPIVIQEGLYKIGRSPESNILCKSEWVSRNHCDVTVKNGKVYIQDLGSLNGTFIEKNEIFKKRDIELRHGDLISLGKPYTGSDPETDHYVYKLVMGTQLEQETNRKRKASSSSPHEVSENGSSLSMLLKRQKRSSLDKQRNDADDHIDLDCGHKSSMERRTSTEQGPHSSHDRKELLSHFLPPPPPPPRCISTVPSSNIECIDLTDDGISEEKESLGVDPPKSSTNDIEINSDNTTYGSSNAAQHNVPVINNLKSENELLTVLMKIIKNNDSTKVLKTIQMLSGELDSNGESAQCRSSVDSGNNSLDKVTEEHADNRSDIPSSNASVSTTDESISIQLQNNSNDIVKPMQMVPDVKLDNSNNCSGKGLEDKTQPKKSLPDTLETEMSELDKVLDKLDAEERKEILNQRKPISGDLTAVENVTGNMNVWDKTNGISSHNGDLKIIDKLSDVMLTSADVILETVQSDIALLPHCEAKDNPIINSKQEMALDIDENQKFQFSQDVDGVVLIESDEELNYSQLFMEQDNEMEHEKAHKNIEVANCDTDEMDILVKEEFFDEIAEDNDENIDLFQSHFSQCSQEQENIRAESPKKKRKSVAFRDDLSNLEQHKAKKCIGSELEDFKIKLKKLEVEPLLLNPEGDNLENYHKTSKDKEIIIESKDINLTEKCQTVSHSDKLMNELYSLKELTINLDKMEIAKFNKESILRRRPDNLLKKVEPNEILKDDSHTHINKIAEKSSILSHVPKIGSSSKECDNLMEKKLAIKNDLSDSRKIASTRCKESVNVRKTKKFVPKKKSLDATYKKKMVSEKDTIGPKYKKKMESEKDTIGPSQSKQAEARSPTDSVEKTSLHSDKESITSSQIKKMESTNNEAVASNQIKVIDAKQEFLNSYRIKHIAADTKDITEPVELPPPDTIPGAKLVKSTLLCKPPITPKRKRGRPKKKETSVTKEAISKQQQKQIVEDRKAKLKSIALQKMSDLKNKGKEILQENEVKVTDNISQERDNVSNKPKDKMVPSGKDEQPNSNDKLASTDDNRLIGVAKITERNRSSILLEGLMEAPDMRRSRNKRKVLEANSKANDMEAIMPVSERARSYNEVAELPPTREQSMTAKVASCLKRSGARKPSKKVTFDLDVKIKIFECEGMLKSVNAMGLKDKAPPPSPMNTSFGAVATNVVTTLDETFYDIIHWNASWINEAKEIEDDPPIYKEKYNCKDLYVSYRDYKRWLYPLMLYELWGNMCKTMSDEDAHKTGRVFDGIVTEHTHYGPLSNTKNLLLLKCFFPIFGRQSHSIVDPMDILLIKALSACEGKRVCFVVFGLVYSSVRISSFRDTYDPVAKHFLSTLNRKPDSCAYFDVLIYKSQQKQISKGFQLRIRPAYNMTTELRQFESLIRLASSPLLHIIIDPSKYSSIHLQQDLNNKIVTKYPLNEEQRNAVLCTTQSVFANKPSISIILGPPGTGKSQVIVGIIEQLLYRFKLKQSSKRKKILLCSQSNTAIDEICLRLLDVRKELPREKRFKLTRFGRKEKIHPRVLEIQTTTLARKEVEKRNLAENFTLELSLLKAQERMVATALENPNSPNMDNYKMKYERIQKNIASFEAISNSKMNNAAREREIEKLVYEEESKVIYHSDIIATTLGSCSHKKISKSFFENSRPGNFREVGVCIIDEATQTTEADILLPLVHDVKQFILVGDPQQLPPLVISKTAKNCGLSQSLFSRLYKVWSGKPSAPVYMLKAQHRMHPEIAHFPSKSFYGGQLKTPSFLAIKRSFKPYTVISHTFAQDSGETNLNEASLVIEVAERLLSEPDLKGLSVGLIVPYQRQRSLIVGLLRDKKLKQLSVNTIDSYQGQERDIVLLSCVRTSGVGFLNDNQRMNVALTRAKKALYIIANFTSLQETSLWKTMLADARERNFFFDYSQSVKIEKLFDFLFERNVKRRKNSNS